MHTLEPHKLDTETRTGFDYWHPKSKAFNPDPDNPTRASWSQIRCEELQRDYASACIRADNAKTHADKLAQTLKWIRKYPDVLEDKFYTRGIDEQIAAYESASLEATQTEGASRQ